MQTINCVLVGDGYVGKTCLLESHQSRRFVENTSKRLDPYEIPVRVSKIVTKLKMIDTDGQDGLGYENYRKYSYTDTDVVLMCFSLDSFKSLQNIEQKWFPEVHHHCHGIPLLLVGTKQDLCESTTEDTHSSFVNSTQGLVIAKKLKCVKYVECSAKNLKELDDLCIDLVKAVLFYREHHKHHECLLM